MDFHVTSACHRDQVVSTGLTRPAGSATLAQNLVSNAAILITLAVPFSWVFGAEFWSPPGLEAKFSVWKQPSCRSYFHRTFIGVSEPLVLVLMNLWQLAIFQANQRRGRAHSWSYHMITSRYLTSFSAFSSPLNRFCCCCQLASSDYCRHFYSLHRFHP